MLNMKMMTAAVVIVGLSASAHAQTGQATDNAANDAWQYVCEAGGCQAVLTLVDNKSGERIVSWTFVYDTSNDRLSTVVTLPLGVAIPTGLGIVLNDGQNFNWAYQVCDKEGCRAVAVLDAEEEASLNDAASVQIKFVPYGSRGAVAVPVPMQGFKEAKAKLKSGSPAAD